MNKYMQEEIHMKKLVIMLLFVLISVIGCNSIDGTTLEDQEEVKKNQPVDMGGK